MILPPEVAERLNEERKRREQNYIPYQPELIIPEEIPQTPTDKPKKVPKKTVVIDLV